MVYREWRSASVAMWQFFDPVTRKGVLTPFLDLSLTDY